MTGADNRKRFITRALASGVLNANDLWQEAMAQVHKGLISELRPLDEVGSVVGGPPGSAVIAPPRGVDQSGEIRACDDVKYSTSNDYFAAKTAIEIPTWGHLGQMGREIKDPNKQCPPTP